MGLLHKVGYIIELVALCLLILYKYWEATENEYSAWAFPVAILLMVGSLYCLARAEVSK